jgi:hypothetical protein
LLELQAQTPPTHDSPAEQVMPQSPQLNGSLVTSAHPEEQRKPEEHSSAQTPFEQTCEPSHGCPQAPQWRASESGLAQVPLQSTRPPLQVQVPARHSSPAAQRTLHSPQFCSSLSGSAHAPPQLRSPP